MRTHISKITSQTSLPVLGRVCEYKPHMYSRKKKFLKTFSACMGFVPGYVGGEGAFVSSSSCQHCPSLLCPALSCQGFQNNHKF